MATDPCAMTSMWVWYLADPSAPQRVGTVTLMPTTKRCSFVYDGEWEKTGFALSPDMPTKTGRPIVPPTDRDAPGALEDAMPDRWGQSMIRVVDRPRRVTNLDFLYFAGDRRFGALGISTSPDVYVPYIDNPLLTADSMEDANDIIQRVLMRQPINARERELLRTGKMGGAQPKMLVGVDGEEWIAKFPKGDPVDYPLIEHASMVLAGQIGIQVAESRVHRINSGHVVMTKRFDRVGGRRIHALSARTGFICEGKAPLPHSPGRQPVLGRRIERQVKPTGQNLQDMAPLRNKRHTDLKLAPIFVGKQGLPRPRRYRSHRDEGEDRPFRALVSVSICEGGPPPTCTGENRAQRVERPKRTGPEFLLLTTARQSRPRSILIPSLAGHANGRDIAMTVIRKARRRGRPGTALGGIKGGDRVRFGRRVPRCPARAGIDLKCRSRVLWRPIYDHIVSLEPY